MLKHALSLGAIFLVAGCGSDRSNQPPPVVPEIRGGSVPGPSSMTDPEALATTGAISSAEIEQAQLALQRSTNPKVREFAQRMIDDHTKAVRTQADLSTKIGVTPSPNPMTRKLRDQSNETMNALRDASPTEFDTMYMNAQIRQHQEAIGMLENRLLPTAQHPDLRDQLSDLRDHWNDHLRKAQEVSSGLMTR